MDFGFFPDVDATRYSYLRLRTLKEAIKDPKILDALLASLEVPGKKLTLLPSEDKIALIERQIDHFRGTKTSIWYQVPAPEVLAASLFRSKLSDKAVGSLFGSVGKEADLARPVIRWLSDKNLTPYKEIPLGTKRVDVVGFQKQGLRDSLKVVGIELKNERSQLNRALDQMTTFAEYTHSMYLACTPWLAADYLDCHSQAPNVHHWDAEVFRRKLSAFGFGLLLVEAETVYEVLTPGNKEPSAGKLKEFVATILGSAAARG